MFEIKGINQAATFLNASVTGLTMINKSLLIAGGTSFKSLTVETLTIADLPFVG